MSQRRVREASAVADAPALLRGAAQNPIDPDNDGDVDTPGSVNDPDKDAPAACPGCQGTGMKEAALCSECMGTGMTMKEAAAGEASMCEVCLSAECMVEGTRRVQEAVLTAKARKAIPKSKFVFPDKAPASGSFPIHDRAHAIAALSRASGKPEEGAVKAAVYKAYPDLKKDSSKEAEPFGGNKAPPFGKDKDGDGKTKESDLPLLERLEALEQSMGVFRSLREAHPASMTPTFSTPARVKTSDGREGYQVILIREGKGNAEDDQWYTGSSIKEMCESGICEGMQAFGNHPTEQEEEDRPERDVKELVGSYHDVKFAESGATPRAEAIFVPLTLDENHPRYGWVVTLAEAAIRSDARHPICGISLFGLSAGDDGDRPDGTHGRIVSMIRPQSGDIVTNAGAGGGFIRQLMESARVRRTRSSKELPPMKAMAYQSAVREATKRVREATSDDERTEALAALDTLDGESIDNVPDTIEQLRESAPKLVEQITESVTREVKESDGDLKVENEQLRMQLRESQTQLSGITNAIGITEALRQADVTDPTELRYYAGKAQERQLREATDIIEMVRTEREFEATREAKLEAKMAERFSELDVEIEGAGARIPAHAMPDDGGVATLRESGLPILDAE